MTTPFDNQVADYSMLAHLFIDLKGKGISLSSVDLDIIKTWEELGIKPDFIANVMIDYFEECKQKSKNFPSNLLPIAKKVRSILIKSSEY